MAEDRKAVAYKRVADFIWAVRHAPNRDWTQAEVYGRTDAIGRPYVSESTYIKAEKGKWQPGVQEPYKATWRALNMALRLPPYTLETVFNLEDHGYDPNDMPIWDPGAVGSSAEMSEAEQRVARRIAERAANGSAK